MVRNLNTFATHLVCLFVSQQQAKVAPCSCKSACMALFPAGRFSQPREQPLAPGGKNATILDMPPRNSAHTGDTEQLAVYSELNKPYQLMLLVYSEFMEGVTQLMEATKSSSIAHRLASLHERREEQGKPSLESLVSGPFFKSCSVALL